MKRKTITMGFGDIANCIYAIAEDNELYTIDELYDYLTQNSEMGYSVTTYTRGEEDA